MAGEAELRIVNSMLALVGEGTQGSLETLHPSIIQMRSILESEDYDLQSTGWWFNREAGVTLVKDFNGRVTVPATALSFQITAPVLAQLSAAEKARYVRRGQYVYDTILHTDVIQKNIVCDLIYRLALDDLPAVALSYLSALAREQANMSDDGDMTKQGVLKDKRAEAWGKLFSKELSTLAVNALQSPQALSLRYRKSGTGVNPNNIGG